MSDYLADFLAAIFTEQGVTNPRQLAEKAAADLRRAKIVDRLAVIRLQILADRETDWRTLKRRYHVSRTFIYKTWGQRSNAA